MDKNEMRERLRDVMMQECRNRTGKPWRHSDYTWPYILWGMVHLEASDMPTETRSKFHSLIASAGGWWKSHGIFLTYEVWKETWDKREPNNSIFDKK